MEFDDDRTTGASALSADESMANKCLDRYGIRIEREGGTFGLRGALDRLQDAYLDDTCRSQIAPSVRKQIADFFTGLNGQVAECLRARGYKASADELGLVADDAPGDQIDACSFEVLDRYR